MYQFVDANLVDPNLIQAGGVIGVEEQMVVIGCNDPPVFHGSSRLELMRGNGYVVCIWNMHSHSYIVEAQKKKERRNRKRNRTQTGQKGLTYSPNLGRR